MKAKSWQLQEITLEVLEAFTVSKQKAKTLPFGKRPVVCFFKHIDDITIKFSNFSFNHPIEELESET